MMSFYACKLIAFSLKHQHHLPTLTYFCTPYIQIPTVFIFHFSNPVRHVVVKLYVMAFSPHDHCHIQLGLSLMLLKVVLPTPASFLCLTQCTCIRSRFSSDVSHMLTLEDSLNKYAQTMFDPKEDYRVSNLLVVVVTLRF